MKLVENNFETECDASRLVVQSALDCSFTKIVVAGEDIEILVLLISLSSDDKEIYFLKPKK